MKNSLSRYRSTSNATLAAATATVLTAGAAHAELVIHTADPILHFGPTWSTIQVSIGLFDGTSDTSWSKDFNIMNACGGSWSFRGGDSTYSNYEISVAHDDYSLSTFNIGDTVDASNEWIASLGSSVESGSHYIGLRATNGEDTYYGWVEVEMLYPASPGYELSVKSWAYETQSGVGAAVVPEPSVSAALMGMAVLGMLAVRKFTKKKAR